MFFSRPAGLNYIDRGDIGEEDFTLVDFTVDDAYHDLTLPDIVPLNAKMVHLKVYGEGTTVNESIRVAPYGYTLLYGTQTLKLQVANVSIERAINIPLFGNRKIKYRVSNNGWVSLEIQILGWWI